jgi:hypothetical protein
MSPGRISQFDRPSITNIAILGIIDNVVNETLQIHDFSGYHLDR